MPQDPKDQGKKPPFPQQEQAHPGSERDMSPRPDYGEETYRGLGRLKGRIAVVTGADSGIGRAFRVNIEAMFHLVRHALPHFEKGGAIVNSASIQAYNPNASILDYAATKGAIVTFTKGLAQHLIERGIRVNCVAPGPVWTPLVAQSFDREKLKDFGKKYPMERPAQPAELAPAYVFLACDESRYVNGEVLGVTGGKPLA